MFPLTLPAQARGVDTLTGAVTTVLKNAPKPLGIWPLMQQDSLSRLLCAQIPRLSEGSAAVLVIAGVRNHRLMRAWYTAIQENRLRRGGPVYVLWTERPAITALRALRHPGMALRTRRLADRQAFRRFAPPGGGGHLLLVLHNGTITHAVPLARAHLKPLLPPLLYAAQNLRKQAVLEPYRTQRMSH